MEPFKVSPHLETLRGCYPDAKSIIIAASNGGESSKAAIARLWLSEGIPYAFQKRPALYESVRGWLSTRLGVSPKEIHLTGSARIGQSLSPKKLGKTFGEHSDLDIFIVSTTLFERMKEDFNTWSYHFESSLVLPSNKKERMYWVENNHRGPKLIERGFLDSKIIPNRDSYPTIKNIAQTMWLLKEKLNVTINAPRVSSASIRCYADWSCYIKQTVISLSN